MSAPSPHLKNSLRKRLYVSLGVIIWSSFLAAGFSSMLFFAAVDPQLLRDAGPAFFEQLNREAGYALGFLFFWCMSALASVLSVFLLSTQRAEHLQSGQSE